jgi:hypothetical protein
VSPVAFLSHLLKVKTNFGHLFLFVLSSLLVVLQILSRGVAGQGYRNRMGSRDAGD